MQGRKRSSAHTRHGTPHSSSAPSTRHATKRRTPQTRRRPGPLPRALASRVPRTAAPGPHHPRIHNAHTKRARTNRSGRATYSAQALGRLPWFAPFLRRSRRLRPRFDMSFSLGLLSRLKHFCTHWPKPPRRRPFAAMKVTEKRSTHQPHGQCAVARKTLHGTAQQHRPTTPTNIGPRSRRNACIQQLAPATFRKEPGHSHEHPAILPEKSLGTALNTGPHSGRATRTQHYGKPAGHLQAGSSAISAR